MRKLFDPNYDGHTHTSWCPHAARNPLREYLDQAVELGLTRYAVTEHIPLPAGFVDPLGEYECAGPIAELPRYLDQAAALRDEYADRLRLYVGLEIDYLGGAQGGWHGDLLALLGKVHHRLDAEATLLSLHFIDEVVVDGYPEVTQRLIPSGGTVDDCHVRYYRLLRSALRASWKWGRLDLRPRRVGHLTLPRKFLRVLPLAEPERVWDEATRTLELIAAEGLQLDYNTAGWDKPDCGEAYLPEPLLSRAIELGVELVLGSDAHRPDDVGRYRDRAVEAVAAAGGTVATKA